MSKSLMENRVPKRGDVCYVTSGNGHPTGSEIWPERYAVIVSNEAINQKSDFVTVVYLTLAKKRDMPYHVDTFCNGKPATILCEQVFSVDKTRLTGYADTLVPETMEKVDIALQLALSTIGTNREKCTGIVKKWILALEKHGLSISGNPAKTDLQETTEIEQLVKERDTWHTLYLQQTEQIQKLLGLAN